MVSAHGGEWKPKKSADKRFLGEPNTTEQHVLENGEIVEDYYGNDGKAVMERHYTDHNRTHTGHTNPHDHIIDWSKGHPSLGSPINYPNGIVSNLNFFRKEVYL